jgi:hypothetical protein
MAGPMRRYFVLGHGQTLGAALALAEDELAAGY